MDPDTEICPAAMVTDDPWVAALYGMLTYPSLRPGVVTTVDLVADRVGPWTLHDVDRAVLAADLVDRLRSTHPDLTRPQDRAVHVGEDELAIVVPFDDPIEALRICCSQVRTLLAAPLLSTQPPSIAHELLQLDQRAERFLTALDQHPAPPSDPSMESELDALPAGPAIEWRRDELLAFIVAADLDPGAALKALRRHCTDHGKPPPRTWAEVAGNAFRVRFVLDWVADTAGARP